MAFGSSVEMPESVFDKFMSKNPEEIVKFYDLFSDRNELIRWIKSVPKSSPLVNFSGDRESEIAVVIPTPTINHPLALNCQNDVFKGLKLIFSDSRSPEKFTSGDDFGTLLIH